LALDVTLTSFQPLPAALRFRHNYIGTEHLLLGVIDAGGPAGDALTGLGLTPEAARELMAAEIADFQAARRGTAN
jgi:ATP-dependent Clp protease ATP-binding subunit ClpC